MTDAGRAGPGRARVVRSDSLTDGVVTLRPWRMEDAPAVAAACTDPLIGRFNPMIPSPYTLRDAETYIEGHLLGPDVAGEVGFAIVAADDGRLLGAIGRRGPVEGRATFGYWIAREERGHGYASRALDLFADWTFATTDAFRLDLYTDPANDISGRVALRCGFELEGLRRAWTLDRSGRPMDMLCYIRIRPLVGGPGGT